MAYFINPLTNAGDVREKEFGWCLIGFGLGGGCRFGSEVPLHYSVRVTIGLEHPRWLICYRVLSSQTFSALFFRHWMMPLLVLAEWLESKLRY